MNNDREKKIGTKSWKKDQGFVILNSFRVVFFKKNVCLVASVDFHLPLRITNFNRTTEHNAEHVAHCRLAYLVHNRKANMSDVMGERITNSVMYGKQATKPASAQRANKPS